ncbi:MULTISPECIES: hypothetical protein [Streptomyces]|uniref:hypothetical protein n=1 Tax=Streptomyces TaxID=1883 RepID=UPI00316AC73E
MYVTESATTPLRDTVTTKRSPPSPSYGLGSGTGAAQAGTLSAATEAAAETAATARRCNTGMGALQV